MRGWNALTQLFVYYVLITTKLQYYVTTLPLARIVKPVALAFVDIKSPVVKMCPTRPGNVNVSSTGTD